MWLEDTETHLMAQNTGCIIVNIVYLGECPWAPGKNMCSVVIGYRVLENVYFKLVISVHQDFYILTDFVCVFVFVLSVTEREEL